MSLRAVYSYNSINNGQQDYFSSSTRIAAAISPTQNIPGASFGFQVAMFCCVPSYSLAAFLKPQ